VKKRIGMGPAGGSSSPIADITDTARLIAFYRAVESERSDALFRDPFARLLAGKRGEEIARRLPGARQSAWITSVRTRVLGLLIGLAVKRSGQAVSKTGGFLLLARA
jgi:O-methyltransferase involved in polyketide biosynthesis